MILRNVENQKSIGVLLTQACVKIIDAYLELIVAPFGYESNLYNAYCERQK